LRALFGRSRLDEELAEEMRFHVEMEIQRHLDAGLPPREARRAALRRFGGFDQLRERSRDEWSFVALELWWKDLRSAVRSLGRSPGFTAFTLLSLALAMGLGATVFSLVDPILFRPLPLREPQQLVTLSEVLTEVPAGFAKLAMNVAYADFRHWRERNHVFADMAVFVAEEVTCATTGQTEALEGARISAGLFAMLGVQPVLGRDFAERDERAGEPASVIIGYDLWRRGFDADSAIVGRSIVVDGRPRTVIGVMPAGFGFPSVAQIWTPLVVPSPENTHGRFAFKCIARLKPGVTLELARRDLATIGEAIAREHPQTNAHVAVWVQSFNKTALGSFAAPSRTLLGAVGLVNLVACLNVASLLLARGLSRHREFAVRAALGAGRWRAIRQLFLECAVLSAAAGILGFFLSFAGLKTVFLLVPDEVSFHPFLLQFEIGLRVFGFTAGMALVSCLVAGLVSAGQAMRSDVLPGLKEAGSNSVSGRRQRRWRGLLVTAEAAGAVVLLSIAGLMVRTLRNLERVDLGFDARRVIGFHVISLPPDQYGTAPQQARFYDTVCAELAKLPGVRSVAVAAPVPLEMLQGSQSSNQFVVEGQPLLRKEEQPFAEFATVSPGYFGTLKIPLVRGRDFTAADNADAPPVAIVDTAFARRVFGRTNPLGRRVKFDAKAADDGSQPWREIVGVVAEVKRNDVMDGEARPGFFLPLAQCPRSRMSVLLRTADGDLAGLMPQVRETMLGIDETVALYRPFSLSESARRSYAGNRIMGQLLAVFSSFALLLAGAGIAGVVAFTVAQRTHEIGVRLALGATSGDVLRLIVAQSMRPVVLGLVVGLGASVALSRWWANLLYGVGRNDPITLAISAAVLGGVALVASYLPARGATRVDPLTVLRAE